MTVASPSHHLCGVHSELRISNDTLVWHEAVLKLNCLAMSSVAERI